MADLRGTIFDLDGVIVNTVPLHFKAWQRMFSEYGKEFTFQDYKEKVDGIPRLSGAKAVLPDLDEEELVRAAEKKQRYFLELLHKEGVEIYHSTVDLIKALRAAGVKRAVVSSSRNCPYILQRASLSDLFDVIIGGGEIVRGKPHPDIFLLAAERIAEGPENCLVFEDAVLGVEAAKAAGMKCVGIDRYQNPQRLSQADIVVEDLDKINLDKLRSLF